MLINPILNNFTGKNIANYNLKQNTCGNKNTPSFGVFYRHSDLYNDYKHSTNHFGETQQKVEKLYDAFDKEFNKSKYKDYLVGLSRKPKYIRSFLSKKRLSDDIIINVSKVNDSGTLKDLKTYNLEYNYLANNDFKTIKDKALELAKTDIEERKCPKFSSSGYSSNYESDSPDFRDPNGIPETLDELWFRVVNTDYNYL